MSTEHFTPETQIEVPAKTSVYRPPAETGVLGTIMLFDQETLLEANGPRYWTHLTYAGYVVHHVALPTQSKQLVAWASAEPMREFVQAMLSHGPIIVIGRRHSASLARIFTHIYRKSVLYSLYLLPIFTNSNLQERELAFGIDGKRIPLACFDGAVLPDDYRAVLRAPASKQELALYQDKLQIMYSPSMANNCVVSPSWDETSTHIVYMLVLGLHKARELQLVQPH